MSALVWHIGTHDLKPDNKYWKTVVQEGAVILAQHKNTDVYVSMHATAEQRELIHSYFDQYGLKPKGENWYTQGEWEVPTIKWMINDILPERDADDCVGYLHTKGVTRGESVQRHYMMDHLMFRYEDNVALMKTHDAITMGCFGIITDFQALRGMYWCTFWIAQVAHLRTMTLNETAGRWASEEFVQFEIGRSLFADNRLSIMMPNQVDKATVIPFDFMQGAKWNMSKEMYDMLQKHNLLRPQDESAYRNMDKEEDPLLKSPTSLHLIYGIVLGIITVCFIVFLTLWLKR